jgi:formate dehydrogenase maturation protein FdhE
LAADENRILRRLQEWADREGELPEFLVLYRDLLSLQSGAKARIAVKSPPSPEVASERQGRGEPVLRFDEIAFDWDLLAELLREVVGILARHKVFSAAEAEAIERVADAPSSLEEASRSFYEGRPVSGIGGAAPRPAALQTVVQIVLWPFLSRYSEALSPLVQQEAWVRGVCPICGGRPDFGFLEKEVGARWLLCSRCDARWLFRRLECPYCGSRDEERLSYLASENGLYRLYLCDVCREYLKVVDLRKTESEVVLPLERLLTLDMDRQAHEADYGPHRARGPLYS